VRLHVVLAGPQDGPALILLHGFPEYWGGWLKQIGPLAQAGYRVIVPDQRGYNLSGKPGGLSAYRVDVLAGDVVHLMDALGYSKFRLVGHDWGGVVAWTVAALYPQHIEKLVILDAPYPAVFSSVLRSDPAQRRKSSYIFTFQLPFLPERMLSKDNWQRLVRSMQNTSPPDTFTPSDFERYRAAWSQPGAISAMLNWYRALLRRPFSLPANQPLRMPVLILWGAKDFALGLELAQASLRFCENGKLVVLDEANHWVQHEKAVEVNQMLIEFFGS
jgi:pimeloyl-ACP methyl ester carboxylesterase